MRAGCSASADRLLTMITGGRDDWNKRCLDKRRGATFVSAAFGRLGISGLWKLAELMQQGRHVEVDGFLVEKPVSAERED